ISYRQPIGFDSSLLGTITSGASIHIDNPAHTISTKFIDTTPGVGGSDLFTDATLQDNKTFIDSINGIEITQRIHTRNYTDLTIRIADMVSPTVSIQN